MNGLLIRYHKNKGYCWKKDAECGVSQPSGQILDTQDEGSWTQGWYCFLVDKNKGQMRDVHMQPIHIFAKQVGENSVKA